MISSYSERSGRSFSKFEDWDLDILHYNSIMTKYYKQNEVSLE